MSHYFFHIRIGNERIQDHEGGDFTDVDAALAEARLAAREILADDIRKGRLSNRERLFEIADDRGSIVATMPFSDILGDKT